MLVSSSTLAATPDWTPYSMQFTADASSMLLTFAGTAYGTVDSGTGLDAVSLAAATPEPSASLLFTFGVAALCSVALLRRPHHLLC